MEMVYSHNIALCLELILGAIHHTVCLGTKRDALSMLIVFL